MKKGLPRLVGGRRSVRSIRETVRLEISMPHHQFSVNSGCTPHWIGSHDPFDQPTNLESGRRSAVSSSVPPGQACPELAKTLPLPLNDCIGLYVAQCSAPAVPDQRQPDPEKAIEGSQHRSLTFSLEGGELNAESGVFSIAMAP